MKDDDLFPPGRGRSLTPEGISKTDMHFDANRGLWILNPTVNSPRDTETVYDHRSRKWLQKDKLDGRNHHRSSSPRSRRKDDDRSVRSQSPAHRQDRTSRRSRSPHRRSPNRRSPHRSPNRRRSPNRAHSGSPARYQRSGPSRRSRSPNRKMSRSPHRKQSPKRRRSRSPGRRRSRSPQRRRSRSPRRRSPAGRRSRSPRRRRSRSHSKRSKSPQRRRGSKSPKKESGAGTTAGVVIEQITDHTTKNSAKKPAHHQEIEKIAEDLKKKSQQITFDGMMQGSEDFWGTSDKKGADKGEQKLKFKVKQVTAPKTIVAKALPGADEEDEQIEVVAAKPSVTQSIPSAAQSMQRHLQQSGMTNTGPTPTYVPKHSLPISKAAEAHQQQIKQVKQEGPSPSLPPPHLTAPSQLAHYAASQSPAMNPASMLQQQPPHVAMPSSHGIQPPPVRPAMAPQTVAYPPMVGMRPPRAFVPGAAAPIAVPGMVPRQIMVPEARPQVAMASIPRPPVQQQRQQPPTATTFTPQIHYYNGKPLVSYLRNVYFTNS